MGKKSIIRAKNSQINIVTLNLTISTFGLNLFFGKSQN